MYERHGSEYRRNPTSPGMRRLLLGLLLVTVVSFGVAASDNQSAVLKIGATVPPTPCRYPDRCKSPPVSTPTSMTVRDGAIRYVGTPPRVERKGDLVTITF